MRKVSERYDTRTLTRTFVHTLVPIAFAYVLAHYFSLLLWQSQAMVYLASDPLGNGVEHVRHERLSDRLPHHLLRGDLVRAGRGAASPATSAGWRSPTTARWCSTGTPKRPCAASTGCSR